MAKSHAGRKAAVTSVRASVVSARPSSGGNHPPNGYAILQQWADTFAATAERLRESADRLDRIADLCRTCHHVLHEGLEALPQLLERLGLRVESFLPGLLEGHGEHGNGAAGGEEGPTVTYGRPGRGGAGEEPLAAAS